MGERKTVKPIAELLQQNKTMLAHATKRIAAFSALDAALDATWLANWQNAIAAAEAIDTDETNRDQLQTKTADVLLKTENTYEALRDLRYYAAKAFGKKTEHYKAFGFARMMLLAAKTPNLILFTMANHALAVQLQTQLMAAGMSAPQIATLNVAAANLALAEVAQELHKRNRLIATGERNARVNDMYGFMQQANSAAIVIYNSDADSRALFEMDANSATEN